MFSQPCVKNSVHTPPLAPRRPLQQTVHILLECILVYLWVIFHQVVIIMIITIHQRNQNVSKDDDTFSKSTQNSLPWVLPDKYITDRLTIKLILCLPILFSLFPPSMNKSLFKKKSNVLPSLVTNNSPMNRFPISNSTYVQISCVKYIPLLCWIRPDFIQKSSLFYQQSLGMIPTHVPIFLKSPYLLGDKIRTTVQLITYTVPQNCLSPFTIHHNSQFTFKAILPLSILAQRLSFRFFS